jgi:hypothetical protein
MSDSPVHADLRAGKRQLRRQRRDLPLPEKVAQVVELQRIVLTQYQRRRSLKAYERIWDLTSSRR